MAQNITLLGASYSAVPSVTLPKTGGGIATFTDTSDADATASDILSGKTAYVNGEKLTGTGSGGGGGLVYETGTWTPSEDVASYWFSFTNTHTEPPFYYMVADSNGDYTDLASTNTFVAYNYFTQVTGNAIYPSTDSTNYGYVVFRYKTSGSLASLGHPISDTRDANSGYPRYWATETGVRAYTSSSSRYWRSGRTYKWIAVWPPTT